MFHAADALELSLAAMSGHGRGHARQRQSHAPRGRSGLSHRDRSRRLAGADLGKPFREAHHIAGAIVKRAEAKGVALDKLPLAEMQKIEPGITEGRLCGVIARGLRQCAHKLRRHGARARARADLGSGGRSSHDDADRSDARLCRLVVSACGTKSALVTPECSKEERADHGTTTPPDASARCGKLAKGQRDPSQPPNPIAR